MDEQISFGISGTVNVDGKKSIDDVSKSIETSITKLEKMEKTAKSVTEALAKMFKGVPTQNLNSKEQTEVNNFAQRYRRREYENSYSQYKQRQNQSFGFTPITDQVSQRRFSPMYDENYALHQRNQMSALSLVRSGTKNVSRVNASYFAVEDRLAKKTQDVIKDLSKQTEELIFENKAGISRAELSKIGKEFDDYEKKLSAMVSEHDKSFLEARIKGTDTLYQKNVKQNYYQNQHQQRYDKWRQQQESIHGSQWYTTETGFAMGPNNAPYGEGQQIAERIHQAQKERAEAEQRIAEQAREHLRQTTEQSRLLLTADAGIKKLKDENLNSEEDIVHEKEQQVEAEKKNTAKSKQMTEYQSNKIRVEDEHNKIRADRAATEAAAEARKKARDNSGYNEYRNAHPELFAVGALYHSKRYQTGHALQSLGGVASTLGSGGRAVGLALDSLGAFFKAVPLGIATTISNLAKGITELGKAAVQAYAEIESIKTQLGVVFSNQTQADAMFGQISQYAVKSPFGVQQTSELAVLLKQSGVYASDLMDTLKMLGDTAGGNMEKMKRIANNYAQIVSIGKASMLDMRQFAYAGIPIFEAVSKELGVSQQELRKLISDGKVTADIVEKVFKDLTGVNGIFENATEKGAKTLKARLQNLQDAKQLAFGEIGQSIVNFGTNTGNDSVANTFVDTAENIYQWLHDNVNTTNIEHDVKTIANRNNRMSELSNAMTAFSDNEIMKSLVGIAYNAEKGLKDIDYERNIYNQSYEAKMKGHNQALERFGISDLNEAEEFLEVIKFLTSSFNRFNYNLTDEDAYKSGAFTEGPRRAQELANKFGLDIEFLTNTTREESKAIIEAAESLVKALSDYSRVTEEETKAHRESTIIDAQQLAFDQAARASSAEGSYTKGFEELYSLYTSSDKYKQEQQQKQIAFLKESQNVLRELVKYADKEGNVDISKLSYNKLLQYIDPNKRVLDEGSKLSVVEGKSEQKMTEDRKLLMSQWTKVSEDVLADLKSKGLFSTAEQLQAAKDAYSLTGDNKTFFENFDRILEQQLGILEELANSESNEAKKAEYQAMSRAIMASTFKYSVNDKGLLANPDDLLKGTKNEFIPLWKRILAQYTGLSTTGMTSTVDTMKNYRDDMAIRNMASDVLSATMKSMGVDSAMKLVAYNDKATLKGDNAATLQVDWKTTKDNIKDFALRLSAATDVIDAYKKGLEDEMETYQQLIIAGITQGESQDANQQKFMTTKQLAKLRLSNAQLVNAFGDTIETESGKTYNVGDVSFDENGRMFDKMGNEITEQVKVTSNLSKFIEDELPRLRKEIKEANVQSGNNKEFDKRLQESLPAILGARLDTSTTYRGTLAGFLTENSSYMMEQFSTIWKDTIAEARDNDRYKTILKGRTDSDVLTGAIMATPENIRNMESKGFAETAEDMRLFAELFQKTLTDLENAAGQLGIGRESENSHNVYNLLYRYLNEREYNNKVSSRYQQLTGTEYAKQLSLTAYEDQGGIGGERGLFARLLKNGWGLDKGYDLTSLNEKAYSTGGQIEVSDSFKKYLQKKYKDQLNMGYESNTLQWGGSEQGVELDDTMKSIVADTLKWKEAMEDTKEIMRELGADMEKVLIDFGKGTWEKPFEKMGENLVLGKQATDGMDKVFKDLTAELLSASGAAMVKAGWELVARGAADKNYGMIGAGLALAGTGAFAAGLGSGLNNQDKETKEAEDKARRLEALKNNLADLLRQAREDAIYYENTLRHKKALSANDEFTTRSVHDAIITPRGEVVTTDPKDYLIATKTPKSLIGSGAPTINFNVVDKSTGIKVTQQKSTYNADTNTIDFEAIIESKVTEVIASSKGDDAFNAREARLRGRSVIA